MINYPVIKEVSMNKEYIYIDGKIIINNENAELLMGFIL